MTKTKKERAWDMLCALTLHHGDAVISDLCQTVNGHDGYHLDRVMRAVDAFESRAAERWPEEPSGVALRDVVDPLPAVVTDTRQFAGHTHICGRWLSKRGWCGLGPGHDDECGKPATLVSNHAEARLAISHGAAPPPPAELVPDSGVLYREGETGLCEHLDVCDGPNDSTVCLHCGMVL